MTSTALRPSLRQWGAACGLALAAAAAPLTATAAPGFGPCRSAVPVDYPGTIVEAAVNTPALSTLTSLVVAAGLGPALAAPGNLTVFAPTNDAFAAIPASVLGAIGSDLGVLTAVLTYHVVDGPADPRRIPIAAATTLQGQSVFLRYQSGVGPTINQSVTGCQAIRATNGTIWVVDSVLLPQFRP
jgi:uncharacterized surface protein with fasciclin (FAS1) repeats